MKGTPAGYTARVQRDFFLPSRRACTHNVPLPAKAIRCTTKDARKMA